MKAKKQALEGIKVADFSWAIAGPLTSKYLADYGATVARVESYDHPCFLRTSGPFSQHKPGPDTTGYYAYFNPNKYSIMIELDKPSGIKVAKRLVEWADVVIENFAPGVMDRRGLDYESLKAVNPDIIMLSSSGQGQTGPFAKVPIGGNWLVALTGFSSLTGWPDREASQPFGAYNDFIAPRFSFMAILAALRHRNLTGEGQYIDVSQLEAGVQFLAPPMLDYTVNGHEDDRMGNASPYAAPHGVYPCLDGRWCTIAVFSDREWQAFCKATGNPGWSKDLKFTTFLNRKHNEDELNKLVSDWTINLTPEDVMKILQDAGVEAGVVENARDLCEDPQLKYRNHFWYMEHKAIGNFGHLGEAAILSETPARAYMPSPCLGEHTQYVATQLLKMSDEEFIELLNEGAFGNC